MESVEKIKILTKFSKEEFLREVWTTLAKEDAPLKLFKKDFDKVETEEYVAFIDKISVDATYQASIGYDREESYIGYETQYEEVEEPVIVRDRESGKRVHNGEYVKKTVEKQVPVEKWRTVTDWQLFPFKGEYQGTDTAFAFTATDENTDEKCALFDTKLFIDKYKHSRADDFAVISGEEAEMLKSSDVVNNYLNKEHEEAIQHSVGNSLPGDHYRDLNCTYKVVDRIFVLCKVPLYKTGIEHNGKIYTKYAFPFGAKLIISGDKIPNNQSVESEKASAEIKLRNNAKKRKAEIEKHIWRRTGFVEILAMFLLLLSIGISLVACILKASVLHNMAFAGIVFGVAAVFFVFNFIFDKLISNKEHEKAISDIKKEEDEEKKKLERFKETHDADLQDALRKKLKTLDYET